jgi:hypothetical protein
MKYRLTPFKSTKKDKYGITSKHQKIKNTR